MFFPKSLLISEIFFEDFFKSFRYRSPGTVMREQIVVDFIRLCLTFVDGCGIVQKLIKKEDI